MRGNEIIRGYKHTMDHSSSSSVKRMMGHVAVGEVSRVHGTSRRLCQWLVFEWLSALGPVEICSVVNVKGRVDDAT